VERVYDPATEQIYEVPAGWYDEYDLRRNEYDLSGLLPLPANDWELWMRAVVDGPTQIH
jgi:hypothetical protein